MSEHQEKTQYDVPLTDVPPLEEAFSLEEILAEYGSSRQQKILEDVERTVREAEPAEEQALPAERSEPVPEKPADRPETDAGPEKAEPPEDPQPLGIPEDPRPISLEEVVGSTVEAVMEERAEPLLKPRRGLFSRRKLEETEELYDSAEPEPEPEPEPIGPEPPLADAAEDFRAEYRQRRGGLWPALLTALVPVVLMLVEQSGVAIPMWTGDFRFQSILLMACLGITALLCRQVIGKGVSMLRRKRCVSELLVTLSVLAALADCGACLLLPERTAVPPYGAIGKGVSMLRRKRCVSELLVTLSVLAALADCGACLLLPERTAVPPYGAAACLALVFAQWGLSRESRGFYDTFRTAALDDQPPYLVADTEQGACKQRGSVPGFYTTAIREEGFVLWQTALLPLVLVGSVVFAGLSSLGQERGADFFLNWSAILAAGATFALPLCWGLPFSALARRLQKAGCAVAGWSGADRISRRRAMIVTDADLFPPGTIQLNGIKIYGEERQKVMSYAATMARCAGCGLERLFDGLLRSETGRYETAVDFSFYEEGGYSAAIHGESVLLGTVSFMRKMNVRIPGDIKLKTGVFLAVDRHLTAVFAVKYNPAETVDFALRMMHRSHILPILASRDPNITPALLKRKFHKGVRVEFPDLTSRVALSEAEQDRDLPRAFLLREGLLPYAETVVGSRRMCSAVRRTAVLSLLGSVIGTLLAFYLVSQGAYGLMTPLLLEVFLLLWTLPVLILAKI